MNDRFRLVRQERRPKPAEARRALERRRVADHLTEHVASAPHYQLEPGLETAVNMALAVGSPLLVTGEPGTGKTQLGYFLADYFGIAMRAFLVKSISTARDLQYEFDAVGYLQSAYATQHGEARRQRSEFLKPGPLWLAYEDSAPSVLLIDEIDKAPRDFPNDLLHELDQGWFQHPFDTDPGGDPARIPKAAGKPPVVVITSNVERRLPGPFLRRCVFHHIELTEKLVRGAVDARVGEFPVLPAAARRLALDLFWEIRDCELQKPPSTAELLVWLAVLNALGAGEGELRVPLAELPALGTLVKDRDDVERLKNL